MKRSTAYFSRWWCGVRGKENLMVHGSGIGVKGGIGTEKGDIEGRNLTPCDSASPGGPEIRLEAIVTGRVQGVGFRWWTKTQADALGLVGVAENLYDGRVRVVAEGARSSVEGLLAALTSGSTVGSVDAVEHGLTAPTGTFQRFGTA